MLKQYEELSVLEQGDDGAIISVRGQDGPSVLLTGSYLLHLERVLYEAEAELVVVQHKPALRLLCSEVGTLLAAYNESRNKYYGAPSPEKSLASALRELDELRRQLDEF